MKHTALATLALLLAPTLQGCPDGIAPPGDYSHLNWPIVQKDAHGRSVSRTYRLHVPPQAARGEPMAVVIDLHPAFNNGWTQNLYSGMTEKADLEGFVVVHPDSVGPGWNVSPETEAEDHGISDVEFIRLGLDELQRHVRIDPARIYATGFSSGAGMAGRLAAASARGELGIHRIAAIAPVSGAPWSGGSAAGPPSFICPEMRTEPVPMRMIVSNNDETIAGLFKLTIPQVNELARSLARDYALANGCADPAASARTGRSGWGVLQETLTWGAGDRRRETILDVFDTGDPDLNGHVWPGRWFGGEYRVTDAIWSFFASHPR